MTVLARSLGIPLNTLHREADRLERAGLVTSRRVGRTRLLSANRYHPAASPLTDLLAVTFGPAQIVAAAFHTVSADQIIIFGSWARRFAGQSGPFPHDIDVLVVGPYTLRPDSYAAADIAQQRLGLEVNTAHRTLAEWNDAENDPLIADIRSHGYITLTGEGTEWHAGDAEPGRSRN